jgi:hypothetical protein
MKISTACLISLLVGQLAFAQSKMLLTKIYVGSDGLAHVVDKDGRDEAFPKEKDQFAISSPRLSADGLAAGWVIEEYNAAVSPSPFPTRLAVYFSGRRRLFGDDMTIYDWCFVSNAKQVALSTGPLHGRAARHLILYDVGSGKLLQEWAGDDKTTPPDWAKDLKV